MQGLTRLVQILLPTTTRTRSQSALEELAHELTTKFGGVTSYVRAPAEGRWLTDARTHHDEITVVEVMTAQIDTLYWSDLRARLERELAQERIVIRSQVIELL